MGRAPQGWAKRVADSQKPKPKKKAAKPKGKKAE